MSPRCRRMGGVMVLLLALVGCTGNPLMPAEADTAEASARPATLPSARLAALAQDPGTRAHQAARAWLLQHPDPGHDALVQHLAARGPGWRRVPELLARMGREEGVAALAQALLDPDPILSWEAGRALGQHPAPEAGQVLLAALHHPSDPVVRAALAGLGQHMDPADCAALISVLGRLNDGPVRADALRLSEDLACLIAAPPDSFAQR